MKYTIIKCKSGGYVGYVNELHGAASQGKTVAELITNLEYAAKSIIEALKISDKEMPHRISDN